MLRFPNPGSDIRCLIRLFQSLFVELSDQEFFSLDDMSAAMVMNNLAASCGRMGDEALERSTRDDRSRDPLYNQSKMYSELFRALGWVTSSEASRLKFQFTTLGAYVAKAGQHADDLVKLCIVGIAFPNPVLDIKFETSVRPFVCILRAMRALDGFMSRDEIILGPMTIRDDRDPGIFAKMIADIRRYRKSRDLRTPLNNLLRARAIAKQTSENYTRFPLAVLKWSRWAVTCEQKIYAGRPQRFYRLTDEGANFVSEIEQYTDFRASDLTEKTPEFKRALTENSFWHMLDSSNFDLTPIKARYDENNAILQKDNIDVNSTIFSPFQELSRSVIESCSEIPVIYHGQAGPQSRQATVVGSGNTSTQSILCKVQLSQAQGPETPRPEEAELATVWEQSHHDLKRAAASFTEIHSDDNKDIFYPLVAKLFTLAGFPCQTSRTGVNYQRWDASIELNGNYIPIEIKSPGEEKQLSVKAIRQAVENHIILLSRVKDKSKPEHTSLAVGFQYPNDRAEVNGLIDNFHKAFGFKIGVIDFRTLAAIAFSSVFLKQKMQNSDLENLYGFLDINS